VKASRTTLGVAALLVALVACTSTTGTVVASSSSPATPSSSHPPFTPPPPPPDAPLTGVVTTEALARRPLLAIKIDNHTAARPHIGLDDADIVYEEPVEGGITRFIAIYQSRNASTVGPIRSARLTDIDVLEQYGRVPLAYSGAAGYVLRAISRSKTISLAHGGLGSIYHRAGGRPAPHNLFSSTKELYAAARARNPSVPRAPFTFGALLEPPQPSGSPSPSTAPARWPSGASVRIPFTSAPWIAVWRYDERQRVYRRWHSSTPHRVAGGEQVTARNVIVMRVETRSVNREAARRGTPQLALTGSGDAVLLRDGVRIAGRWSRAALSDMFAFTDARGRPWTFATGNTWIELVPTRIRPSYG